MNMSDELSILRQTGANVELLDSGCCGMAGPFGFEKDKYEVSQKLGERVLLPAVRLNSEATIIADGFSCCEQITQNTTTRPRHLAEVLAQTTDTRETTSAAN
jgi:Fe-S oxidoreductase